MREILFKGKRKDNGDFVEGYFGVFKGIPQIFVPFTAEQERQNEGHIYSAVGGLWYEVILETVGQFTGLYDNTKWEELTVEEQAEFLYPKDGGKHSKEEWKGKPIFDGDILKFTDRFVYVKWHEKCAAWDCSFLEHLKGKKTETFERQSNRWCENAKVIGNIHDNTELLGGLNND